MKPLILFILIHEHIIFLEIQNKIGLKNVLNISFLELTITKIYKFSFEIVDVVYDII